MMNPGTHGFAICGVASRTVANPRDQGLDEDERGLNRPSAAECRDTDILSRDFVDTKEPNMRE